MSSPWPPVKLGDVTINHDAKRIPVREVHRKSGPYAYYGASGVVDKVDGYLFEGLHLLIAEDGENLRTRNTPVAFLADGRFWVNNHAHIVTGNHRADTRFLCYALAATDISGYLTGSAMPKLTQRAMNAIEILLPPINAQRTIAEVLGSLDDKIEQNRRTGAKLEGLARAVFKAWFVDFEPVKAKAAGATAFPGMPPETFAALPTRFTDSELGPVPYGWEVNTLKKATKKIGSGATPRGGSTVYVANGVSFIRSQNVYDHVFRWEGLARLCEQSAAELKSVEIMNGDILLNITGDSILRTCVVDPAVIPARVSQHVAIIRPAPGIPSRYLHLLMVHSRTKTTLLGMNAGGTRQAITKENLESLNVVVPDAGILALFESSTRALFDLVDTHRAESRKLAALRDYLLPRLLSGQVRIDSSNFSKQGN